MAPKTKRPLSQDDRQVWNALTKTVIPLKSDAFVRNTTGSDTLRSSTILADPSADKNEKRVSAATQTSHDAMRELVENQNRSKASHAKSVHSVQHNPALMPGVTANIDRRTAVRLKQGRLPIEGRLDLHGMTRDVAFEAVRSFVEASVVQGRRCVILVTGKGLGQSGGGVLRNEVPRWLNLPQNRKYIVGFTHAQPKDGGTGALYLYLKRPERVPKR